VSAAAWGAVLGLTAGSAAWLVVARLGAGLRSDLTRILSQAGDVSELGAAPAPQGALRQVFGPLLTAAAARLERLLGGSASVRRRLERAGLQPDVHAFRVQQVLWGLGAFSMASVFGVLVALRSPERLVPLLVLVGVAGAAGVLLRDNRLTAQVRAWERRVLAELPSVAELLALSVAAGEGPVAALERVVGRSRGALGQELGRVIGDIRTGTPVAASFDDYSRRTGLPVVSRFAAGIAVAVERGTPLADVLRAQAADVREATRRELIESGARREVAMMVPVVFLVLPTTVLFAFWPGVVGLQLVTP